MTHYVLITAKQYLIFLYFIQFNEAMKSYATPQSPKFKTIVVGALDSKRKTNTGMYMCKFVFSHFILNYNSSTDLKDGSIL